MVRGVLSSGRGKNRATTALPGDLGMGIQARSNTLRYVRNTSNSSWAAAASADQALAAETRRQRGPCCGPCCAASVEAGVASFVSTLTLGGALVTSNATRRFLARFSAVSLLT